MSLFFHPEVGRLLEAPFTNTTTNYDLNDCICPTSDLPSAPVAEWEQSSAVRFQNVVESLKPKEWRLLGKPMNDARQFWNEMLDKHTLTHCLGVRCPLQL